MRAILAAVRRFLQARSGPRWHRWCTAHTHCDWRRNVDDANGDNSSAPCRPTSRRIDDEEERLAEFRALLLT